MLIISLVQNLKKFDDPLDEIVTISAHECNVIQERIPVGCVPPALQPYVLWWPPLDVSAGGYPRSHIQGRVYLPLPL